MAERFSGWRRWGNPGSRWSASRRPKPAGTGRTAKARSWSESPSAAASARTPAASAAAAAAAEFRRPASWTSSPDARWSCTRPPGWTRTASSGPVSFQSSRSCEAAGVAAAAAGVATAALWWWTSRGPRRGRYRSVASRWVERISGWLGGPGWPCSPGNHGEVVWKADKAIDFYLKVLALNRY